MEKIKSLLEMKDVPFVILAAVSLPQLDGIELREFLIENERLREKSVPFIFLTTHADPNTVNKAYNLMVQGYFEKQILK